MDVSAITAGITSGSGFLLFAAYLIYLKCTDGKGATSSLPVLPTGRDPEEGKEEENKETTKAREGKGLPGLQRTRLVAASSESKSQEVSEPSESASESWVGRTHEEPFSVSITIEK
jgi:hypothetical protein